MNLRAMNMLYESIVKRGSLMVVPSGLADSLNVPSLLGVAGAGGLLPRDGATDTAGAAVAGRAADDMVESGSATVS
ncbi:hypothetical protein BH23GEM2_BH23GEM2_06410 [soil metagenome]